MINEKIFICIPVYNEGKVVSDVVRSLFLLEYRSVIIVDDGSSDDTYAEAKKSGALVLRHLINRGKGAAIKTAIEASKILGADIIVTMDGDGQHNPEDIEKMINSIRLGNDVVLGTRLRSTKKMPWHKVLANGVGNFFTMLLYGLWVTDSQSGFRVYSKKAISKINTRTDRYEYDSEVIREVHINKLKYSEIPIEIRYTKHSMGKKDKQNFKNGLKTLIKMFISS